VRSRAWSGKPARQLRTAWTDAWERADSPDPLPMPLQGIVHMEALHRVTRANNRDLHGFPVGQIVGRMNQVRSSREVVLDMVEEWIDTTQRLSGLIESK
jgi:NAD(P)H-dependent flavin oxidoreductase YrpB (nitropropane dioxygenase family)